MKCEGCPVALHVYGYKDNRVGNPKEHKWYPNNVCMKRRAECHLTTADFPIINAMIAGEWDCEKCDSFEHCLEEQGGMPWACKNWKSKGGDEE